MISTLELVRFHAVFSYVCLGISLLLNTLVVALVRKSEKLDSIRYIFYGHSLADTVFAVSSSISLMYWAHLPHVILFFPTGPLAHIPILAPVAIQLQASAYVIILCLVCSTFLHRHKLIIGTYESRTIFIRILEGLAYFPAVHWILASSFLLNPDRQLRAIANKILSAQFDLDFEKIYLIGTDITVLTAVNPLLLMSTVMIIFEICGISMVIMWCGCGIHRFIQRSTSSERLKLMQRNVLRMLIIQVIHPAVLLLIPTILFFTQFTLDFKLSDKANLFLSLCFVVYPVSSPILSIVQSPELKAVFSKNVLSVFMRSQRDTIASMHT